MFTGIVQSKQAITKLEKQPGLWRLSLNLPQQRLAGLELGASIAVNGACLTVSQIDAPTVHFDVMMATLNITNLQYLKQGDVVNVERAARFGDDIGGHQLSGHIHNTVEVVDIEYPENNRIIWFELKAEHKPYIFDKGYVGLNGCSLTIASVEAERFCVYLIPETLSITTFGEIQVGDSINLEIDSQTQVIVDTVERVLKQRDLA
ncbi:riboflavin synthase subunit alpha [Bermanella sp. R86510]|uniref:riboflavin synthase subunit alpha n=1 Tax=unclassified Bermanella TaxID=2627862 RepID=UPI0037CBFDE2